MIKNCASRWSFTTNGVFLFIIIIIIKHEMMDKDCNLECLLSKIRRLFILTVEIQRQLQYLNSIYAKQRHGGPVPM
jgi:hypothetical protein